MRTMQCAISSDRNSSLYAAMKALNRETFFANGLWIYGATGAGFQVFENFCILKRKFQFVSIEYLENNDFVAVEAELLKAKGDVFRRLEEIGKKQYDTAPVDQPNRMLKKL